MNTCSTCKFWQNIGKGEGGICELITPAAGVSHTSKASVRGVSQVGARLYTAPDFGCNQHVQRPPSLSKGVLDGADLSGNVETVQRQTT